MFEQMTFGFEIPKPSPSKLIDPETYLRHLIDSGEPLIYVYGENPHLGFFRTHSSEDCGTPWPLMRRVLDPLLNGNYSFHCYHFDARGQRALVYYIRKRK